MNSKKLTPLQRDLLALGFVDVFGSMEFAGGTEQPVKEFSDEEQLHGGQNNGLICIIDDCNHPWILRALVLHLREQEDQYKAVLRDYNLIMTGITVPHSNGGGRFAYNVWAWSFQK